jgi:hypothetical protein
MCTFVHILKLVSLHPEGGSRTGGGRWPTREPSSSISRSQSRSSTSSLSITFWADWPLSPTVHMGRSRRTGTSCSFRIIPAECVITATGRAVGASSSTSTLGPWYGRQTIPVTHKSHNVHLGAHWQSLVNTGKFHVLNVHTVTATPPKIVKLTFLDNHLSFWDEPKGSFYNEPCLRIRAIFQYRKPFH